MQQYNIVGRLRQYYITKVWHAFFMTLVNELKEYGFDDKKARVYLAILELGQAKVHEIAYKAGVARPTAYDILEKLTFDGLAGAYEKRGIRYYIANDPEKIKRNLQEKQKNFEKLNFFE